MRTIPYIRSMNGIKITFLDIQPNQIRIRPILLHLAKTCRYHGMLDGWYSNAEHSMLCSHFAGDNVFTQRAALIHDFGEHITADVAGPVKKLCPDYTKLCDDVQAKMNFHFLGYDYLQPIIKEIDKRLTASEQRDLRGSPPEDWDAEPYEEVPFKMWDWREAYHHITVRFIALFPEYKDAV